MKYFDKTKNVLLRLRQLSGYQDPFPTDCWGLFTSYELHWQSSIFTPFIVPFRGLKQYSRMHFTICLYCTRTSYPHSLSYLHSNQCFSFRFIWKVKQSKKCHLAWVTVLYSHSVAPGFHDLHSSHFGFNGKGALIQKSFKWAVFHLLEMIPQLVSTERLNLNSFQFKQIWVSMHCFLWEHSALWDPNKPDPWSRITFVSLVFLKWAHQMTLGFHSLKVCFTRIIKTPEENNS